MCAYPIPAFNAAGSGQCFGMGWLGGVVWWIGIPCPSSRRSSGGRISSSSGGGGWEEMVIQLISANARRLREGKGQCSGESLNTGGAHLPSSLVPRLPVSLSQFRGEGSSLSIAFTRFPPLALQYLNHLRKLAGVTCSLLIDCLVLASFFIAASSPPFGAARGFTIGAPASSIDPSAWWLSAATYLGMDSASRESL